MQKKTKHLLFYGLSHFIGLPVLLILILPIGIGFELLIPKKIFLIVFLLLLATGIIGWIGWLIRGVRKSDETIWKPVRNVIVIVVIAHLLLIYIGYQAIFGDRCINKERSPCGKYKMKIYDTGGLFYMTAPGDGGNRPLKVVLKDRWGRTIGVEEEITNSLEIEWDYNFNILWTSRGNGIYFK